MELKDTQADPEEAVQVVVYSKKLKKHRLQLLKRRNLIDKVVMVTDVGKKRTIGICRGFSAEDGRTIIEMKDSTAPHPTEPNVVFVLEN